MSDYFLSFESLVWPEIILRENFAWLINVVGQIANEENQ